MTDADGGARGTQDHEAKIMHAMRAGTEIHIHHQPAPNACMILLDAGGVERAGMLEEWSRTSS